MYWILGTPQLEYFVRKYLAREGTKTTTANGLLGFVVPKKLKEVAARLETHDKYDTKDVLGDKVERATVDKEFAQTTRDCRLLRFGDVAFEAMVRHVQDADYSDGVTSICVPAAMLQWSEGDEGVCVLFSLRVLRQAGSAGGAQVLRQELLPVLVPKQGPPRLAETFFAALPDAQPGPLAFDPERVRVAYEVAREFASTSLTQLRKEVEDAYATREGILPELQDFALAWVRGT